MHNSFHILCIFILSSCKTSQFARRILIPPWPDHRVPTWNPSRWRRASPHREDRFLDVAYYSRTTCCGSLSSSTRRRHRYNQGLSRHSGLLRCAVPYTETPLGPEMPAVGKAICRLFKTICGLRGSPTGAWHERPGDPPISTVHVSHCPLHTPYFVPVSPISSRRTNRSGVSEWTGYFLPFTRSSSIRFATVFGPRRNESLNVSRCSQESIAPVDRRLGYLPSRLDGRRES